MPIAYRVYHAPEGSDPAFCGEYESHTAAAAAAEQEPCGLEASLYDTARSAGHCGGQTAPDLAGVETGSPVSWHGDEGWHCVVAVRYAD